MKKPNPKVFISATSEDLRTVRDAIKQSLLQLECMPVEQTNFGPDYRTVEAFLRSKISECDAVIHVVGDRYGAEPNPESLPPGSIRRSYTQMEYDIGKQLRKKVFVFLCGDGFPYDTCETEDAVKRNLQIAHKSVLMSGNQKYEQVSNHGECDLKVRQLQLQLEEIAEKFAASQRRSRRSMFFVSASLLTLTSVMVLIFFRQEETIEDAKSSCERFGGSADNVRRNA